MYPASFTQFPRKAATQWTCVAWISPCPGYSSLYSSLPRMIHQFIFMLSITVWTLLCYSLSNTFASDVDRWSLEYKLLMKEIFSPIQQNNCTVHMYAQFKTILQRTWTVNYHIQSYIKSCRNRVIEIVHSWTALHLFWCAFKFNAIVVPLHGTEVPPFLLWWK